MNILFVCENYFPHIGGVEIVFKNLAEGLIKQGHQVALVTHQLKGTPKRETIKGVHIHRVPCFDNRYLFTFFAIPKVLRLAKKADIIHTTTFNGAPPAWLASKIHHKPCVLTVHEVWINQWHKITNMNKISSVIHNFLEKSIYRLDYTHYVCVSQSTQKQLSQLNIKPHKISVIYNGVDYQHWQPRKNKKSQNFCYCFNGRPGTSKGLEYLIKAVPLISRLIPHSKLVAFVSQDPAYQKNYQKIIKLIKKLKIQDKVTLHPPVSYKNLPSYLQSADCIVVPSLAEGFGFTAAEACALGVPVVASNTASLPEVVSGKFVLVEPQNPQAIARGVHQVFQKQYQKNHLKKFELQNNINNYLTLYENLNRSRTLST